MNQPTLQEPLIHFRHLNFTPEIGDTVNAIQSCLGLQVGAVMEEDEAERAIAQAVEEFSPEEDPRLKRWKGHFQAHLTELTKVLSAEACTADYLSSIAQKARVIVPLVLASAKNIKEGLGSDTNQFLSELINYLVYPNYQMEFRVGIGGTEDELNARHCTYIVPALEVMKAFEAAGAKPPKLVIVNGKALADAINEMDPTTTARIAREGQELFAAFIDQFYPTLREAVEFRTPSAADLFDDPNFEANLNALRNIDNEIASAIESAKANLNGKKEGLSSGAMEFARWAVTFTEKAEKKESLLGAIFNKQKPLPGLENEDVVVLNALSEALKNFSQQIHDYIKANKSSLEAIVETLEDKLKGRIFGAKKAKMSQGALKEEEAFVTAFKSHIFVDEFKSLREELKKTHPEIEEFHQAEEEICAAVEERTALLKNKYALEFLLATLAHHGQSDEILFQPEFFAPQHKFGTTATGRTFMPLLDLVGVRDLRKQLNEVRQLRRVQDAVAGLIENGKTHGCQNDEGTLRYAAAHPLAALFGEQYPEATHVSGSREARPHSIVKFGGSGEIQFNTVSAYLAGLSGLGPNSANFSRRPTPLYITMRNGGNPPPYYTDRENLEIFLAQGIPSGEDRSWQHPDFSVFQENPHVTLEQYQQWLSNRTQHDQTT